MPWLWNYSPNNFIPQLVKCGKDMLPEEHKMPHQPGSNLKGLIASVCVSV